MEIKYQQKLFRDELTEAWRSSLSILLAYGRSYNEAISILRGIPQLPRNPSLKGQIEAKDEA